MRSIRYIICVCIMLIFVMGMNSCIAEVSSLEEEEKTGGDIHVKIESQQEGYSELQVPEFIDTPEVEDGIVVYFGKKYVDADPPYPYLEEDTLPDFLTEEQKILYRQALSIFRFFSGNSMGINDFIVLQEGEVIHNTIIQADNGYSYCQVNGKYQNWNDFHNMILHVFTKEYFDMLNRNSKGIEKFIRIDGNTCAILADKGSVPGYGIVPDTYELVSASEDEIVFDVTCGYQNGTDPETGEAVIEYRTFDIILKKTEEGWRFSKFNCGAWYRE